MRPLTTTILIASTLALASCSSSGPEPAAERVTISGLVTEKLAQGPMANPHEAPGSVRSKTSTAISARIPGQIVAIAVDEGNRVRPGQVLIEIDDRDAAVLARKSEAGENEARLALDEIDRAIRAAESARNAATAGRDLAAATLKRYSELRDRRSISAQEFDEVQTRHAVAEAEVSRATESIEALKAKRGQVLARIEQAQAERAAAALQMGYTRLAAPAGGVVTARHAEPGMLASPGLPLLTVEDDSRYQLEVAVEESQLAGMRRGAPVRVRIDAAGLDLEARVSEILPAADAASRTATVRIDLPASPALRSGLFGRASFAMGDRMALSVPQSAVVRRGQLTGLWMLDNGIVRYRLVRLGKADGQRIEVLSGAAQGDTLIVSPLDKLTDGLEARQ